MREINLLVVHCSATKPNQDIGVDEIRDWHKERGFSDVGYHDIIRRNGLLEKGRPVDKPGAHAKGHNEHTIGVCLIGGIDQQGNPDFNFTDRQMRTLRDYINQSRDTHNLTQKQIVGHRDLPGVDKACPCFDVVAWLS